MQGSFNTLHHHSSVCRLAISDREVGKSQYVFHFNSFSESVVSASRARPLLHVAHLDGGEIMLGEREIDSFTRQELARLIGVVLTERPQVQNLTVFQMAAMGRSPYTGFFGRLSDDDRRIVGESLRMVGIEHLAGRMAGTLSDGERQKMMTAKALAQQTSVVFLDEPTAFLDYGSKVETLQMLRSLCHDNGKTILLSTHDLELALQIADDLWVMTHERLITGPTAALAADGTLSRFIDKRGIRFDPATMTIRVVAE